VLASSLIPLLFFFLLTFAENRRWPHLVGITSIFFVFVFCHPMMAAIYAVFASVCTLLLWLVKVSSWRSALQMIACMALGIGLSGWWLLPSLTGGITELNSSAVTQGLVVSKLSILLNPLLRLRNPEADYVGLSLIILSIVSLISQWNKDRRVFVFTVTGLLGILAYTPILNQLFNALPGHNLLWPYRFQGICGFLILLSSLWGISAFSKKKLGLQSFFLLAILILDAGLSQRLIGMRDPAQAIVTVSTEMGSETGWREITFDKSALGSQAVYFIDTLAQREQVFGWAYQGAKTASNIASLNDAIDYGTVPYLRNRLAMFGVDDVLISNTSVPGDSIITALSQDGFQSIYQDNAITYLHRDGQPRAILAEWSGLAIGTGAVNYSFLFPQIVQGNSPYLDDYSLEEIGRYQTLVLAGFSWHNQETAEALVEAATSQNIRVVIDLTRTQQNPVAQIPEFLNVWGEPIILGPTSFSTVWEGQQLELSGFGQPGELWYTLTPQGVDQSEGTFEYLGQPATVVGSLRRGENKIFFLGLNLVYHALETQDSVALS
ncbi:hypothetical protein EG832_10585, partial [bacterium]|nr:hypothetical protein [bacterium]